MKQVVFWLLSLIANAPSRFDSGCRKGLLSHEEKRSLDMALGTRRTRTIEIGDLRIGGDGEIAVQSMCATPTKDIDATLSQIRLLSEHGADIIRVAVDSRKDVEALKSIRGQTAARLSVDLQEHYRLVSEVAPLVQKVRYNPGHLHHQQKAVSVIDKVRFIANSAGEHNCAIRVGVNFGSLDHNHSVHDAGPIEQALASACEHVEYLEQIGFKNYLVSLKSSDPNAVVALNRRFAHECPDVPLHLGVTEAGMLPMGEVKSRIALEQLLTDGIGDTIRVSLTLPFEAKYLEVLIGRRIVEDVRLGRGTAPKSFEQKGLNIISCPSCSRVENSAFVDLAEKVRVMSAFAADHNITIAVMGCRVNGPGETDDADIGLWCAPQHVNLKRRSVALGTYRYDEILDKVKAELETLIAEGAGRLV
jgi:(E)-4-hydroxy-3-methylbut-2-enyl-diphosphate synthase